MKKEKHEKKEEKEEGGGDKILFGSEVGVAKAGRKIREKRRRRRRTRFTGPIQRKKEECDGKKWAEVD